MTHTTCVLIAVVFLFHNSSASAFATKQFQEWYPEYGFMFKRILEENCTEQYQYYLSGQKNMTRLDLYDQWDGSSKTSALAQPVASCILRNTSDWIKSGMASAAVLLGVTPAILAILGPSIEETSSLFIFGSRPFLVMCLALGSPSINPIRAMEYRKPLEILKPRDDGLKLPNWPDWVHHIIVLIEYLLVAAAIVNIATLIHDLGL
ncbi:hypothetical protein BT63DRAFT_113190 [Microthyrium microscopicum]|uniref:Uncharacterized protein n=1 Tax=Microthyrium microscopicum TaxID=703497 RepID=A0A6A6TYB9_9PEZI|nr:hypothetical protein BT63DRAFT_113190 [Microthyrium microscopicum]